jgi:chromosome segregation ATPase
MTAYKKTIDGLYKQLLEVSRLNQTLLQAQKERDLQAIAQDKEIQGLKQQVLECECRMEAQKHEFQSAWQTAERRVTETARERRAAEMELEDLKAELEKLKGQKSKTPTTKTQPSKRKA